MKVNAPAAKDTKAVAPVVVTPRVEEVVPVVEEEPEEKEVVVSIDDGFETHMLKPSEIARLSGASKLKVVMLQFYQWFFRPRSSYENERVDYNTLNILAEYQCFNLEFAKQ